MEFKKSGIGIIVGRFQVPEFHEGHKYLIDTVSALHDRVYVFLGCNPGNPSIEDPLDYGIRAQMIQDLYPNIVCLPIFDTGDDIVWSRTLDKQISALTLDYPVTLYGGRDSFIEHYYGKYKTKEIPPVSVVSGTEIRTSIKPVNTTDFRRGVIWGLLNQFPRVNPTVDIAVIKTEQILLAKKNGIRGYMFPGGYFDTRKDQSFEDAAIRELYEETRLALPSGKYNLSYEGSFIVDDWRFKGKRDKTLTVLFSCEYFEGVPIASDDIDELFWINFDPSSEHLIADHHKPLFKKLLLHD